MPSPETFNSSTTWTCPAGVTAVQAEVIGGGAGGEQAGEENSSGGGGGGGYSKKLVIAVTPGNNYTVTVGAAVGAGVNGNDSWFVNNTTVLAKGGISGSGGTGGAGGALASGIGDTKFSGGKGGDADFGSPYDGGGGGGGATSGGTGSAGVDSQNNGNGEAGTAPGGGGGGASGGGPEYVGGTGAAGRVILTYTAGVIGRSFGAIIG